MEKLIINNETDNNIIRNLEKLNIDIIKTVNNDNLLYPLRAHPDMLIHVLPNGNIIADRDNFLYYENKLKNFKVIKSEKSLSSEYPNDIVLNGVCFKNLFIHNLKYTDKNLLDYYRENGYELIDVKQGYTKCNIAVGKNVLITSDMDIYEKVKSHANILLIDHKQIKLEGFNYGFIGGASGLINDTLYFTGSLKSHSSYNKIIDFLNENNEKYSFLSNNDIIDYGSIIFLKNIEK